MKSISYELKYCEGCGTLKLRPVTSPTDYCRICERLLARFRFPQATLARNYGGLANAARQKALGGIPLAVCGNVPAGRTS